MDQVKGPFMIKKMKLIVYSVCQSLINLPLPRGYFQLTVEMSLYSGCCCCEEVTVVEKLK